MDFLLRKIQEMLQIRRWVLQRIRCGQAPLDDLQQPSDLLLQISREMLQVSLGLLQIKIHLLQVNADLQQNCQSAPSALLDGKPVKDAVPL
jgi:hypothetical protein